MPIPGEHDPMSSESEPEQESKPVARRVAAAIDDALHGAAGTIEDVADAAMDATATARRWVQRPGARVRAVRRLAKQPLPMLYEEHPEARNATPRELGLQTIEVADIVGTAVGGARQRGGDFLPLKPFRSENWRSRWQRLRSAADRLVPLPPIDVVRFGGRYWVLDGHNRVASALYGGQITIDANVTDLLLPGQARSERPSSLAAQVDASRELRASLSRRSTRAESGTDAGTAAGTDAVEASDSARSDEDG
jgi:hypothetical protein